MISDAVTETIALQSAIVASSRDHNILSMLEAEDFAEPLLKKLFLLCRQSFNKRGEVHWGDLEDGVQKYRSGKPYYWLETVNQQLYFLPDYQVASRLREVRARREAEEFKVRGDTESYPTQFSKKSKELTELLSPAKVDTDTLIDEIRQGVPVVETGFDKLDGLGGILEEGGMMILCGYPGTGKTALALNIARNIVTSGRAVYFASLEMSRSAILKRFLQCFWNCTAAEVDCHADDMRKMPGDIRISNPSSHIDRLLADMTMNIDCDFFIIDYFTLIQNSGNKYEAHEEACHAIKRFAFENKKPVLLLAQPNRKQMNESGNRLPQLSDIGWCPALEQDAHVVVFLWDENGKANEQERKVGGIAAAFEGTEEAAPDLKLVVRKNRNGRKDVVIPVNFDGAKMIFTEA